MWIMRRYAHSILNLRRFSESKAYPAQVFEDVQWSHIRVFEDVFKDKVKRENVQSANSDWSEITVKPASSLLQTLTYIFIQFKKPIETHFFKVIFFLYLVLTEVFMAAFELAK